MFCSFNCKILQNVFLSSVEMFHCTVSLRMARFQNLVKGKDKGLPKKGLDFHETSGQALLSKSKEIHPDSSLTECHTIVKSAYLLCSRGPASLHVAMHNEMAMLSFKKMKEAFLECRACLRMPTCSLSATLYWHFLTLPPPSKPSPTPFLE